MGKKADDFEGMDIMWYINHPDELEKLMDGIIDDELTTGRIRSIYVQVNYGHNNPGRIADYYNIPVEAVKAIANGSLLGKLTKSIRNYEGGDNHE